LKVLNQNLNELKESQSNREALFNQALDDPNADKVSTATRNLKAATHGIERAMKQNPLGDDIFGKIEDIVEKTPGENPTFPSGKLLEDIVLRAGIYASLLKPSEISDEHVRSSCLTMREVLDSYRIFMLNALDPRYGLEQSQMREISRCCEILSLRWVLTGGNAQKLEDHFQDTAKLFRAASTIVAAIPPPPPSPTSSQSI
jgi:hypothetical protein